MRLFALRSLPYAIAFALSSTMALAQTPPETACQFHVPNLRMQLDTGDAKDIEWILQALLDDVAVQAHLATLDADASQPWFAVLFHENFINALVDDTPARIAQWDVLADTLEDAYSRQPNNAS